MKPIALLIQLKRERVLLHGVNGYFWRKENGLLEVLHNDHKSFFNLDEVVFAAKLGDLETYDK